MNLQTIRGHLRDRFWFAAAVALFLTGFAIANLPLQVECIGRPTIFHAGEEYPPWTSLPTSPSDQVYRLAGFPRRYLFSQYDPSGMTSHWDINWPALFANALVLIVVIALAKLELGRSSSALRGRMQWSFPQVLLLTVCVSSFMMWTLERGVWNPKGLAQISKSPSLIVTRSTAFTWVPKILRGLTATHLFGSSFWPVAKEMESPEPENLLSIESVPGLQHLTLSHCNDELFSTNHDWTSKWIHLDLRSSTISSAGLRWLAAQTQLQSISLENCAIESSSEYPGKAQLPAFPSLQTFDAHTSRIERDFLSQIGRNLSLEHLELHISQLSAELFESLRGHPRLRILVIEGDDQTANSQNSGEDVRCSLKDLPRLEWLVFRRVHRLDLQLENLPSLHEIQFENKGAIVGGTEANYVELQQCIIRDCPNVRLQAALRLGTTVKQQIDSPTRDLSLDLEGTEDQLRQFLSHSKQWKGSGFWRLRATEGQAPLDLLPSGIEHLDVASIANLEPLTFKGRFPSLNSLSISHPVDSERLVEVLASLSTLLNLKATIHKPELSVSSHFRLKNMKLTVRNAVVASATSVHLPSDGKIPKISLADLSNLESLAIDIDHSNFALQLSDLPSLSIANDLGAGRPRQLILENLPALTSLRLDSRLESLQLKGSFPGLRQLDLQDVTTQVAIEAISKADSLKTPLDLLNWRPKKESSRKVLMLLDKVRCSQLTIQSVDFDGEDWISLFQSPWQGRSVRFLNCGFIEETRTFVEAPTGLPRTVPAGNQLILVGQIVMIDCDMSKTFALGQAGRVRTRHLDISRSNVDPASLMFILEVDTPWPSLTVLPGSTTNRPTLVVRSDQCSAELLDRLKNISTEVHLQVLGRIPPGWQAKLPQHFLTEL